MITISGAVSRLARFFICLLLAIGPAGALVYYDQSTTASPAAMADKHSDISSSTKYKLKIPRPHAVESHASRYERRVRNCQDATGLSRGVFTLVLSWKLERRSATTVSL